MSEKIGPTFKRNSFMHGGPFRRLVAGAAVEIVRRSVRRAKRMQQPDNSRLRLFVPKSDSGPYPTLGNP